MRPANWPTRRRLSTALALTGKRRIAGVTPETLHRALVVESGPHRMHRRPQVGPGVVRRPHGQGLGA